MPDAPRQPDAATLALVVRAQGGDRDAVAELCARYTPRVRGLTALRLGSTLVDMNDFDDIVQETMLTALRNLHGFRAESEGRFIAWLASIAESRILDARRSGHAQKRGGGAVQRRADLGVTTISSLGGGDPARSPSEVASAVELDGRLERALLGLGSPLREIVYHKLVLEMEHAEIAAELGLASADSSRALFSKALARLRERLDDPRAD
ncbi:MAG: sigma-70 family RNA polymerase sigma factor [Planctomycetes bacterium]|nr:sigma-70 family RNA polymerase sigma factor [Planctomycetota bacterium]